MQYKKVQTFHSTELTIKVQVFDNILTTCKNFYKNLVMYFQKFRLPPPSSNFLADIIGLKKKQATRDQSKMGEGMAMILV